MTRVSRTQAMMIRWHTFMTAGTLDIACVGQEGCTAPWRAKAAFILPNVTSRIRI